MEESNRYPRKDCGYIFKHNKNPETGKHAQGKPEKVSSNYNTTKYSGPEGLVWYNRLLYRIKSNF